VASGTLNWLTSRLTTATVQGSSVNYRLVAPLEVLSDVFENSPLGAPLGTIETTFAEYDLLNGASRGTSLDNGAYLFIFYTGLVGVILLGACAMLAVALLLSRNRRGGVAVLVGLMMLGYSGGILLPEFVLGLGLFIYAWRTRPRGELDDGQTPAVEFGHRDVQGLEWPQSDRRKPPVPAT
jgi:putative colanic acid polymerase